MHVVEWKRKLTAHGDAREEKWRGKRRMAWVISSFQFDSEQSIQCYYNRSPPTLTPRKSVLDWTDTPADINGLVRFAGRPNLVSARVPSHPVFTLTVTERRDVHWISNVQKNLKKEISPVTGPRCPEGSRKLRLPDYVAMARYGGKVVSLKHRPPLPPGNTPGTHFC